MSTDKKLYLLLVPPVVLIAVLLVAGILMNPIPSYAAAKEAIDSNLSTRYENGYYVASEKTMKIGSKEISAFVLCIGGPNAGWEWSVATAEKVGDAWRPLSSFAATLRGNGRLPIADFGEKAGVYVELSEPSTKTEEMIQVNEYLYAKVTWK